MLKIANLYLAWSRVGKKPSSIIILVLNMLLSFYHILEGGGGGGDKYLVIDSCLVLTGWGSCDICTFHFFPIRCPTLHKILTHFSFFNFQFSPLSNQYCKNIFRATGFNFEDVLYTYGWLIDNTKNLIFWCRFLNKLEPSHTVYIMQQ